MGDVTIDISKLICDSTRSRSTQGCISGKGMMRSAIAMHMKNRLEEKHELEPETSKIVELVVRGD